MSVDADIRAPGPSYPPGEPRPTAAPRRDEGPVTAGGDGRDPVRWLLRVAPLGVLATMLATVLRLSALHLGNDDTWFHLVLGHRFRTGWSLTAPGGPTPFATSGWVPTQWSTEVLASLVEGRWGLPGVAWLFGALYLALIIGTYLSCRARGRPLAAVVATCLLVLGAAPVLSARPQVVSLVLLTVTVAAWLRTVDDGRPRWWLVPMTGIWATAHGLWSAGVLFGLVCWLGLALDRRVTGRRSLTVLAVPVLSLVATTLTPVGPRLLTSQLAVSARTGLVPEWGATSFRSVPALAVALMLGLLVVVWVRRGGLSWSRVLVLALAAGWTLLVTRMVPLGGVVAAPLLAEALERALADAGVEHGRPGTRRWERSALAALAAAYLVVLALAAPRLAAAPADEPTALAPRLAALPAGSTVLVEDGIGGWMEWRVPQVHPVIDGMLDAYPVGYIRDFLAMTRVEPGWRGFVEGSGARAAVLDRGSPLSVAMQERLGWHVVQRDRSWLYLEAPQ